MFDWTHRKHIWICSFTLWRFHWPHELHSDKYNYLPTKVGRWDQKELQGRQNQTAGVPFSELAKKPLASHSLFALDPVSKTSINSLLCCALCVNIYSHMMFMLVSLPYVVYRFTLFHIIAAFVMSFLRSLCHTLCSPILARMSLYPLSQVLRKRAGSRSLNIRDTAGISGWKSVPRRT